MLRRKDGTTYDQTFDWFQPILQGDPVWLNILPGETIHLEMEPEGNALRPRRIVTELRAPERTVTFQFSQDAKLGMLLTVNNPFSRPLKYDLFMLLLEDREEKPRSTSSCPVVPHLQVYESWPDVIFTLTVTNFRFVEEAAAHTCDAAQLRERP